jgi:hypothetical protein
MRFMIIQESNPAPEAGIRPREALLATVATDI